MLPIREGFMVAGILFTLGVVGVLVRTVVERRVYAPATDTIVCGAPSANATRPRYTHHRAANCATV